MAEFDLTTRMGQYLDRHLVFPLLEFLSVKEASVWFWLFSLFPWCNFLRLCFLMTYFRMPAFWPPYDAISSLCTCCKQGIIIMIVFRLRKYDAERKTLMSTLLYMIMLTCLSVHEYTWVCLNACMVCVGPIVFSLQCVMYIETGHSNYPSACFVYYALYVHPRVNKAIKKVL
jgi:hypothetical protein